MGYDIKIPAITVRVTRLDLTVEGDEILSEDSRREIQSSGFTVRGGMWIGLEMDCGAEFNATDYLLILRRNENNRNEDRVIAEANSAWTHDIEHHDFHAFRNHNQGSRSWGADFVNTIIAEHEGTLPRAWLDLALMEMKSANTIQ